MNDFLQAAIYAPIGGIIVAFIAWVKDRQKDKVASQYNVAQGAQIVQGMALEMLDPLRTKVGRLEKLLKELEDEFEMLKDAFKNERHERLKAERERDEYKTLYESIQQ